MIVVRMELWPGGDESRKRPLGVAFIVNDGTGTVDRGSYAVMLSRMKDATEPWRLGRVRDWPRRTGSPWDLLVKACAAAMRNRTNMDYTLRRAMMSTARRAMNGQSDMFEGGEDAEDDFTGAQDAEVEETR